MVFSSILFLFRFLPISIFLYVISPRKIKNFTILVCSLFFYSWGEPKYFPIMIASILVDFIAGNVIEKHRDSKAICRSMLGVSLFFNLGMLFVFKYTDFFIRNVNAVTGMDIAMINLTLPLGISFYTFQTLSYTIDVYRGNVKAERNIINFGAFVALFPQLIAGPIVKYSDISHELTNRRFDARQVEDGVELFILGVGKKVLIANSVGALWTEIGTLGFGNISTPLAWLGAIAFSLQIYFDFSGYSLMAIGLGKMLGFNFPQNFNFPYIAKSFTDFWRRWHMTLGSWFREYVYIPLGGNRKGTARTYFNIFVVWFATGFWHGANWNFIMWGLFFLAFLVIEKAFLLKYLDKSKVLSHIYVIFFLIISWVLFAVSDLSQLGTYFSAMFGRGIVSNDWMYYLKNYFVTFVIAIVLSTPVIYKQYEKYKKYKILNTIVLGVILVISVAYLVDSTYNPFLYFNF